MDRLEHNDPRTLGPYRVLGRLSEGGMGQVYVGIDPAGRRAALKVVHSELAADPGFRERFRREVRMAATAPPWFTAPVLAADPDAERPWLATAFVDGPSLQARVQDHGPLPPPQLAAVAGRLADGLAALHGIGLVHRDLKPSNIMLAPEGARLIDFGIARAADSTSLTRTGHLLGTPSFMSPEQATGSRTIGPPSDVFSLGVVMFYAATGESPFTAETPAGTLYKIANHEPDRSAVPPPLRDVVGACLTKDASTRPTAAEVAGALRNGTRLRAAPTVYAPPTATKVGMPLPLPQNQGPAPTRTENPAAPAGAPRRRGRWIAAAAAVLVVALGAVLLLRPELLSGSSAGPADIGSDSAPVDAAADPRFGSPARFKTPSGNIACQMSTTEVRCDVLTQSWDVPPTPASCRGTWAQGTVLAAGRPGELSCVADSLAAPELGVLEYGEAVQLAGVVCVSRQTGVRCESRTTLHGFSISKAAFELF
ncbi:serine/threonine-protein kinase [Pseudonocardia sp. TRM90224]|uniref:serine/threonine-protein kinase n=1 Tax=Pseudonocardia sp. TRM90224 TaxID=2812678 RepID=UPI001E3F1D05|nr:serine/threonine-protein kinase [Pseudonocardia sp. TRM90224]